MIALNTQEPESRDYREDGSLEIVGDPWYTLQGEGPFAGRPAVFVRLAGCNLQCPWCDTDYTTDRKRWGEKDLSEKIINDTLPDDKPSQYRKNLIVFTGGEPFRQNLEPLVSTLLWAKCEVQVETNGTMYPEHPFGFPFVTDAVTIVCSPKTPTINPKMERWIKAYKYVLDADHVADDGLPLHTLGNEVGVARPHSGFRGEVFVQPADPITSYDEETGRNDLKSYDAAYRRNVQAAVESCMKFGYRLSIQVHKVIGVK